MILVFVLGTIITSAQTEYLVTVNPFNADISKVDSLPGVRWIQADPAYQQSTKAFTFIGLYERNQGPVYLFTVNAQTGAVLSNPVIPFGNSLVHLKYSNSTGKPFRIIGFTVQICLAL